MLTTRATPIRAFTIKHVGLGLSTLLTDLQGHEAFGMMTMHKLHALLLPVIYTYIYPGNILSMVKGKTREKKLVCAK